MHVEIGSYADSSDEEEEVGGEYYVDVGDDHGMVGEQTVGDDLPPTAAKAKKKKTKKDKKVTVKLPEDKIGMLFGSSSSSRSRSRSRGGFMGGMGRGSGYRFFLGSQI